MPLADCFQTPSTRCVALALLNIPIALWVGSAFFNDWTDFWSWLVSLLHLEDALFLDWDSVQAARFDGYVLVLVLLASAALFCGEYRFFWGDPFAQVQVRE